MKNSRGFLGIAVAAAAIGLLTSGCSNPAGVGQGPTAPTSIDIVGSLDPLPQGGQRQFAATVRPEGAPQAVEWTIDEPATGGGTIQDGLLVAMAAEGAQITIRATAVGHPTVFGTATVTVAAPVTPGSVVVTPASSYVGQGGQRQFSATVGPEGAPQAVAWTVEPPSAGSITAGGLLTVTGATAGDSFAVRATAVNHPAISDAATVTVPEPISITVTGIPDQYHGSWAKMILTIPGTISVVSWVDETFIPGSSMTFTFYGTEPGIYDVFFADQNLFFGAYRAPSRNIAAGDNSVPWSTFASVPPSMTITITGIPVEYSDGFGGMELTCAATGDWIDFGWSDTEITGASAAFNFWFVAPGTYDVLLWIQGSNRWGEAVAPAINVTATTAIQWSAFDFVDGGEVMSVTVTGIPERYHGDWGDLYLYIPGTSNRIASAEVFPVRSTTVFGLRDAEPGTYDVTLWLNDFGARYVLPSPMAITAGTTIPFDQFVPALSGFSADFERAERAFSATPGARRRR